jgi:hypothetical protein
MISRKRKHIPMMEIAASFAADKLALISPKAAEAVYYMRMARISARAMLNQFTPDHIHAHALGGSDKWWNLDMRPRGAELKAKDRADTKRVAKVKRLDHKWEPFMRAMAKGKKPPPRPSRWPKRKFQQRQNG